MGRACGVPSGGRECVEPIDKEMGDGFCTAHSQEWRQSTEFRAATKDEAVGFAAGLRIKSMLTTAMRSHKKRWLSRLAKEMP